MSYLLLGKDDDDPALWYWEPATAATPVPKVPEHKFVEVSKRDNAKVFDCGCGCGQRKIVYSGKGTAPDIEVFAQREGGSINNVLACKGELADSATCVLENPLSTGAN